MADRIDARTNTAPPTAVVSFLTKLNRNRQAKVLADAAAKEAKAQVNRLNGERAAIFTQAEDEGLDKEAIRMLDEWAQRDNSDLNRLLENVFKYARVAEVPIYREPTAEQPQGALWASDEERQRSKDDLDASAAEADGCVAGMEGVDIDSNPHPVGSLKFQSWARGHAVGAADQKKGGPGVPKIASAAPKAGKPAAAAKPAAAPKAASKAKPAAAKPGKKRRDTIGETVGTA